MFGRGQRLWRGGGEGRHVISHGDGNMCFLMVTRALPNRRAYKVDVVVDSFNVVGGMAVKHRQDEVPELVPGLVVRRGGSNLG